MVEGIDLPLACAATCLASVQRAADGHAGGDDRRCDLLKQAVLHDPLVGAICTPEEVWQMVDEMLVAQAQWLPQYADAIPAAAERMRSPKIATRDWDGAARRACAASTSCDREPSLRHRSGSVAKSWSSPDNGVVRSS